VGITAGERIHCVAMVCRRRSAVAGIALAGGSDPRGARIWVPEHPIARARCARSRAILAPALEARRVLSGRPPRGEGHAFGGGTK